MIVMFEKVKDYTTIEQSEDLLQAGLPADSADMFYPTRTYDYPKIKAHAYGHIPDEKKSIPCWSFARLLRLYGWCCGVGMTNVPTTAIMEHMINLIGYCIGHKTFDFKRLDELREIEEY